MTIAIPFRASLAGRNPGFFPSVGRTSLEAGLVFAWAQRNGRPLDYVSSTAGTVTNAVAGALGALPRMTFAGGGDLNSFVNFGTNLATAALVNTPATWAVYGSWTGIGQSNYRPLGQNDGNVSVGWYVGVNSGNSAGLVIEGSTADMRALVDLSSGAQATVSGVPFAFVCAHDGSALHANCRVYINGVLQAHVNSQNSVGAVGAPTAESLYLSRARFGNTGSHQGDLMVVLIAARQWSAAEAMAFTRNPFSVFARERRVQTTAYVPSVQTGNSLFFGSAA